MIYRPVPARLPVPAGLGRFLVLSTVFVCAACGLVYELELVALASYLTGDTVTQASVVLSVMVFAMGVGSLLAKRLRGRAAFGFGVVEAVLALTGGLSAMALHACFAWYGQAKPALVGFSLAIGVLIGAEVPLLMTLIQRIRRQDAGGAVADLFAADYVGALVGGLAFPFLLLPVLGQLSGALLTGAINAVAGGALVLWLFRGDLTARARGALIAANVVVLLLLAAGSALTGPFEKAALQAMYGADVRVAVHTGVQDVVLTGGGPGGQPALFLDGRLRAGGGDASRYQEALVQPAMDGPHRRVLVLGGGDGLALREVLSHPDVAEATVVEPDTAELRLARTDPGLVALNQGAYRDPRVRVETADAFDWLRARHDADGPYDVVVSDLPDPDVTTDAKLYSQEFYGLVARALAPDGRLAVHAGAPEERPHTFWTVDATVRSVGLRTVPYRVTAGSPHGGGRGEGWGFVLASRFPVQLRPARLTVAVGPDEVRRREAGLLPSTLMHPRYGQ
ncbi:MULTISPECIES: polyamine aminopropyltransferase [Streptomyces]|uniref:Polyamine aminopropyltransferase n=1 Tax=Streptomyces morookaense TaxID=1970 RepID=A0A7Y7B0Q5_STRMO|nr:MULTISPECIES: polyamine aminopropyltransferase [Streptomyces]MCC2275131.1 polyamine aminopropyltransferase [Streptomyces sp. ET3-23]NVK76903.1 polyamine aminopropyltransferase [Streptomyces morookaense]GHF25700.1 polyamine aminopropyltransferase 2 [Streptomyces morookaense]